MCDVLLKPCFLITFFVVILRLYLNLIFVCVTFSFNHFIVLRTFYHIYKQRQLFLFHVLFIYVVFLNQWKSPVSMPR